MAWKNGDPGIVFIDRINRDNPTPHKGAIEATNPCGEQPLLPYESCNLGSINLSVMVREKNNGGCEVDWPRLEKTAQKAVRFLDNVIDVNRYPVPEIEKMTKANRKIGLGVMGFADMLIKLGIPYNSEEALGVAESVMDFIQKKGGAATAELAAMRGAYPNQNGNGAVRNATVTTIAPTGTISIIAGCSSGIEPLFAVAFTRTVMEGTELAEVNPLFEKIARERGFYTPALVKEIAKKGCLDGVQVPDDIKRVFITAHDIVPEWHIKMQAAFQKYTDNAVSKTVNFPHEATKEDVEKAYLLAYRLGCKGVTVYRDGSKDCQVLTMGAEKKSVQPKEDAAETPSPRPRGEVAFGVTKRMKTGCGNLYVTINEDPQGSPMEIFTQMGKAGGCATSQCEAIGRLASLALRSGIDALEIAKQMRGISCHVPVGYGEGKVNSCSDAMAQALEWYLGFKRSVGEHPLLTGRGAITADVKPLFTLSGNPVNKRGACPDCGGTVEHADGCVVCRGCGFTECG
jgi:ribonucleoside-diphosphate reductase alpha chain